MWKRSERRKKVDCQQVDAWLVAYLKDGLSPQRRQMVEDHLAACGKCTRSVQQAQILESELRLQAARHYPTLSAEASARIHERVYGRMRRGLIMQRTVRLVGVAVAVMAIVVLAAGAMALWQGRPSEVSTEEDVTPEIGEGTLTLVPATATSVPPEETAVPSPAEATAPPTGPAPAYQTYTVGEDLGYSLGMADLNGDTFPDIMVGDLGRDVVVLLLNQGDGTYGEAVEIATGKDPRTLTGADLNGDSFTDLVVTHDPWDEGGKLSILLNDGDGTFQQQVDYATVLNWFVSAADLDGDGDLDLVIDDADEEDHQAGEDCGSKVWLNNGDGTFQEGESYIPELPSLVSVHAADLNGDTYPDLAARHYPHDTITVRFGTGDGSFGDPMSYEAAYGMKWLVVADLNGDAYPDLAGVGSRLVLVFINNGDGTFADRVDYEVGGNPFNIVAVDMDGDASLDLVVGPTGSGMASVLTNNGDGTFELTKDYDDKGVPADLFTVSDVDGDGNPDLVSWDETSVYVFPLKGND